ncbi:MAG: GNAT family N-acetyltransferase [Verrucomicrobia bacterium]|nr:GNAT family N-acetyltransferase [Verrucomicrobiota bacterium]
MKTDRLALRTAHKDDASQLEQFYLENRDHFMRFESLPRNAVAQLHQWYFEECEGTARRFLIVNPEDVIMGMCHFTQIFRGPFQACYLGYKLAEKFQGQGIMFEALSLAIPFMFEKENLHRIMANYMPSNERSARLLQKLGFIIEGQAKSYLFINGKWEDHVLSSLTNTDWRPPE